MKKRNLTLAILAMVVATLVSVAIVSCKKEDTVAPTGQHAAKAAFTPPQVDDMNAYLKGFKQRMQSAAKGDGQTLSLDEAAWHLACLANVDFCKINVEYNDVQFDTVEMQVNASDGAIAMSDLNTAYEQMRNEIQQFKKGFNHCDQNLYFINVFINGSGDARIALMTTFVTSSKDMGDHLWYFEDSYIYDTACYFFFDPYTIYPWNGYGMTELQRILNLYEHHENTAISLCFIPTRNYTFSYPNWPDPYGNTFTGNSRVFAGDASLGAHINLSQNEMCYCLDSYLGLGYDYIEGNPIYSEEFPVNWLIADTIIQFPLHRHPTHMHLLTVQYGRPFAIVD